MTTCEGLRAIVTGGSRGIGYAIAHELAGHGAALSICARGAPGLEAAAEKLRVLGREVYFHALDVADGAALAKWVQHSAQSMGGIDIVVHSASALIGLARRAGARPTPARSRADRDPVPAGRR